MPRKRRHAKPLDTIWEVSDDLWGRIEPILRADWQPSPKGGQPPKDWRRILNGIIHRLRSGCHWTHLPNQFGADSTIHPWSHRGCRRGGRGKVGAARAARCAGLARFTGTGRVPTAAWARPASGGKKVGPN